MTYRSSIKSIITIQVTVIASLTRAIEFRHGAGNLSIKDCDKVSLSSLNGTREKML